MRTIMSEFERHLQKVKNQHTCSTIMLIEGRQWNIDDLKEEIEKGAMEVYKTLGAGYEETVYEEAMEVEFRNRKIPYEIERNTEIFYKGYKVGMHRLDFILDGKLVVELKAQMSITKSHESQLSAYLRTLKMDEGVLVNFPYPDKDEPEIKTLQNGLVQDED